MVGPGTPPPIEIPGLDLYYHQRTAADRRQEQPAVESEEEEEEERSPPTPTKTKRSEIAVIPLPLCFFFLLLCNFKTDQSIFVKSEILYFLFTSKKKKLTFVVTKKWKSLA